MNKTAENVFQFYEELDKYDRKQLKNIINTFRAKIVEKLSPEDEKYLKGFEHSMIYYINRIIAE